MPPRKLLWRICRDKPQLNGMLRFRSFVLALLLSALAAAAPVWKAFKSGPAHFVTVFPSIPQARSSQTDSPIGAVTTEIYTSTVAWGSYSVAYTELPGAAVRFAPDKVIQDAREGILQDAGAQQQSWVPINGGNELTYRAGPKQGWSQIFLVGNRLYVLDARVKVGTDRGRWVLPFFAKFASQ